MPVAIPITGSPPPPSSLAAGRYVVAADLQAVMTPDEWLQLTDRNADGAPDLEVVQTAIDGAENWLHGYLARRYLLPLDASDTLLMAFVRPLLVRKAWSLLYPRADMIGKDLEAMVGDAEKLLQDVRDGKQDLPATAPIATPATSQVPLVWSADPRRITGLP